MRRLRLSGPEVLFMHDLIGPARIRSDYRLNRPAHNGDAELFVDAKTVIGCVYGSTDADRDFPVLVDLVRQGAIDAEGLVTRRIGLEDVNDAFRAMEAGEVARSVIVYDDNPGIGTGNDTGTGTGAVAGRGTES